MNHFIYNPTAGSLSKREKKQIVEYLNRIPDSTLHFTKSPGDGSIIAKELILSNASKVIVVGGDGSVNEVAKVLTKSNIPMGIIPIGSGNGLARHLKIPMDFYKAVDLSLSGISNHIDIGCINEYMFFCTAGIGFDANVAHHFSKSKKRGLLNYIISSVITFFKYKPIKISINKSNEEKLFSCTVANANQFGNNAYISPYSSLTDGKLELVKISHANIYHMFILVYRMFKGNIHISNKVSISTFDKLEIKCQKKIPIHFDGEAIYSESDTSVSYTHLTLPTNREV